MKKKSIRDRRHVNIFKSVEDHSIIFTSFVAMSADRRPPPEFVGPLPIRKTRAGLQFTCAAPTTANGQTPRDVWVCNSDGYVGQICVLSLISEPPHVESCNGVCNARILCIASIPAPRLRYEFIILNSIPKLDNPCIIALQSWSWVFSFIANLLQM